MADQRLVITKLKAIDVAAGFRRIPAGYYVVVLVEKDEYRTSINPASFDGRTTMCEWTDRVLMASDSSSKIQFQIRASFELGFTLGDGILLRKLNISLATLIKYSGASFSITFLRNDVKVLSPCSSLEMTISVVSPRSINAIAPYNPVITDAFLSLTQSTVTGHKYILSYHNDGDESNLDTAITEFQRVLEYCPSNHPTRSAALSNLAMAKLSRYQAKGANAMADLDLSISLYQEALDALPDDRPVYFTSLLNLAVALLFRLNERNDTVDAKRFEELLSRVIEVSRPGSFECWISTAISQAPAAPGTVYWRLPFSFRQLDYVVEQCKQRNDAKLLDEVIFQHHNASVFHAAGSSEWNALQSSFALALLTRFEHRGLEQDLNAAIQRWRDVLKGMSTGCQDRPMTLNNIAFALTMRFRTQGDRDDLGEATELQREALLLRPVGHPDRTVSMDNLATTLVTLFRQEGDEKHLTEAVQLQREALLLRPTGHGDRRTSLSNLATTLLTQFEESGVEETLDEAIQLHREAVELFPEGHPRQCTALHNLATALFIRFEGFGEIQYLEEAIELHQKVLLLRPAGHPNRSDTLNNLAAAVTRKFEEGGDRKDIDEVIGLQRESLELFGVGNPHRSTALHNLANALCTRFSELGGDGADIDDAVKLHREALQMRSPGHPDRPSSLNGLAVALWTRFDHNGNQRDLEEATRLLRDDLDSLPEGNTRRPVLLNSLAITLLEWFRRGGDRKDLDEAIQHHRDALSFTLPGNPDRSRSLTNLALVLLQSCGRTLDRKPLDEAVQHLREALDLCPIGNPHRPTALSNLAVALSLQARIIRPDNEGTDDAGKILGLHREALLLLPVGHVERSTLLQRLAGALGNDQKYLDEAIQLQREALELRIPGDASRVGTLADLAESLWARFVHGGAKQDSEEALRLCQTALVNCPSSDPRQAEVHLAVAKIHLGIYKAEGLEEYLHSAMHHFEVATSFKSGNVTLRVAAAILWARAADSLQHGSALDAYARSLQLLDTYISMAASPSSRHFSMKNFPTNLPVDAASCALRRGNIHRAVELVEQGRALLWTQMARFRTPLDDLCSHYPSAEPLVKRFRDLSDMLNQQPADLDLDDVPTDESHRPSAEAKVRHYNDLFDDWTEVVERVRAFDGFSRFLLPPLFSDLQEASCGGPVIVLIASSFSCDAIIVLHDRSPIHVCLATTLEKLNAIANQLQKETFPSASTQELELGAISDTLGSRASQPQRNTDDDTANLLDLILSSRPKTSGVIVEVLRELWDTVVGPVVVELEHILKKGSRIWWCPTSIFTAFPLHAAGQYRRGGRDLERLYISSYAPSLSALIKARRRKQGSPPAHFSAIVQAKPAGPYQELMFADREADVVQNLLPPPPVTAFTKLASDASTRDEALRTLQTNRWIHFSCHGNQNFETPFDSHLAMADAALSLLDIVVHAADLSHHEFAFLSACQTAVGDEATPDEMIHLAAGLQFAGVKSVIGTLWTISDAIAYMLVPEFYRVFCAGGVMDCTRAARALHAGVIALAKKKVPLEERIMFVHIGI